MRNEELERSLKSERDLLTYLRLLKKTLPDYTVIITVGDTGAAEYFTQECAEAMMDLGLKVNMLKRYRQPYIAVINRGTVVEEKVSENLEAPLVSKGRLNHHGTVVYSAGFNYRHGIGCGAMVLIDGADYLPDGLSSWNRGFNFLVFDAERDMIVDTCSFDTFDMGKCVRSSNPVSQALLSFAKKHRGIQLCTFSYPRLPSKYNLDVTPFEKFLIDKKFKMGDILSKKATMKTIWGKKQLPFCSDYESDEDFYEVFQTPESMFYSDGSRRFLDYASHAVNLKNGVRITLHQPTDAKRAIFLVGHCKLYGWGATDAYTPASLLQERLSSKAAEKGFIVHNYSYVGPNNSELLCNLHSLPLKQGDVILFWNEQQTAIWGIPHCDLSLKSVRPHEYGEIFTDSDPHYTHSGNRMIADGIFEFLQKNDFFEKNLPADVGTPVHMEQTANEDEDEQLHAYKGKLKNFYTKKISPKIGSIVMNCNPFTNGHRYLVEQALKRCDYLIVFVVEEDKSVFPFADRIELVRKSLADLKRVSVIPSGQFIISTRTFKEYFSKESLQEHRIDTSLDVTMFAKEIAPCLNISVRFAGEEPLDNVTRQYNENMARLLPQYGIKFTEIPRMKYKGTPINASEVRRLAEARQFDKLKKLVPVPTLHYLRKTFPKT